MLTILLRMCLHTVLLYWRSVISKIITKVCVAGAFLEFSFDRQNISFTALYQTCLQYISYCETKILHLLHLLTPQLKKSDQKRQHLWCSLQGPPNHVRIWLPIACSFQLFKTHMELVTSSNLQMSNRKRCHLYWTDWQQYIVVEGIYPEFQ